MCYSKFIMNTGVALHSLYSLEAQKSFVYDTMCFGRGDLWQLVNSDSFTTDYQPAVQYLFEAGELKMDTIQRSIHSMIQTPLTNGLRPILYTCIALLNLEVKEYGQFIISGGEAFNMNVKPEFRRLTPDIDTKFVFHAPISAGSEAHQYAALLLFQETLWFAALEKVLHYLNQQYTHLYETVLKPLEDMPEFRALGVTFFSPKETKNMCVFRKRLTIMPKVESDEVNRYTDIPLFAVDILLKSYFYPEEGDDAAEFNTHDDVFITGMLDLPVMRHGELGADIADSENYSVVTFTTAGPTLPPAPSAVMFSSKGVLEEVELSLPIASKKFITEDINLMIDLKVRKAKSSKDVYRQMVLEDEANHYPLLTAARTSYYEHDYDPGSVSDVINRNNVNHMSVGKIIHFTAPPEVDADGTVDRNIGVVYECFEEQHLVKFANSSKFNYDTKKWENCCRDAPGRDSEDAKCCDSQTSPLPYRINTAVFTKHLKKGDPLLDEATRIILCLLRQMREYVKLVLAQTKHRKNREPVGEMGTYNTPLETMALLGRMLYGYNDLIDDCLLIPTVVSNILIFVVSLQHDPRATFRGVGNTIVYDLVKLQTIFASKSGYGVQLLDVGCRSLYPAAAPDRTDSTTAITSTRRIMTRSQKKRMGR